MKWLLIAIALCSLPPAYCDLKKDIQNWHQIAEKAMAEKEYAIAKDAYKSLLDHIDVWQAGSSKKYIVDWKTYVDTVLRFAKVCEELRDVESGRLAIESLLAKKPPENLSPSIRLLYTQKISPRQAYTEMNEIAKTFPVELWLGEHRSYFHALQYNLNKYYDLLLKKGKLYLFAACYEEARDIYKEILEAIETGYYPKAAVSTSLIQTYAQFRLAESRWRSIEKTKEEFTQQKIDLAADFYLKKHTYESKIIGGGCFQNLQDNAYAILEMAFFYYREGNYAKAKPLFESIFNLPDSTKNELLARQCLARIYLHEKKLALAEEILDILKDSHDGETLFLQGLVKYKKNDFLAAINFLERAFHADNKGSLVQEILMYLAWSYIQAAREIDDPDVQSLHYKKAEHILSGLKDNENACISLARLCFQNRSCNISLEENLAKKLSLFSSANQLEAILYLAEMQKDKLLKEKFIADAAQKIYSQEEFYFASQLLSQQEKNGPIIFPFELQKDNIPGLPIPIAALQTKFDCWPDEAVLFLKGIITFLEGNFLDAEETLKSLCDSFPKGAFTDRALGFLGNIYLMQNQFELAKQSFLKLIQEFPSSVYAPEACLRAAKIAERIGDDSSYSLFLKCYHSYPESVQASEAFFCSVPYISYLSHEISAMLHLKNFPSRFPNSPRLPQVYFLIGKDLGDLDASQANYKMAAQQFIGLSPEIILNVDFTYFEAMLELAKQLQHKNPEITFRLLHHLQKNCLHDASEYNGQIDKLIVETCFRLKELR